MRVYPSHRFMNTPKFILCVPTIVAAPHLSLRNQTHPEGNKTPKRATLAEVIYCSCNLSTTAGIQHRKPIGSMYHWNLKPSFLVVITFITHMPYAKGLKPSLFYGLLGSKGMVYLPH